MPTGEGASRCFTERDELLLRAVVDVACQLLAHSSWAATIRRREWNSSMRRTFRKDDAGLRREVVD